MLNAKKMAEKAIVIIKKAAQSHAPEDHFGRKFDDLFEEGNGSEVMREMMNVYYVDPQLQKAIEKVDHWIGIDNVKVRYPEETTLFS